MAETDHYRTMPEDLDARFAGVDANLGAIREVQALRTTRFTTTRAEAQSVGRSGQPRFFGG